MPDDTEDAGDPAPDQDPTPLDPESETAAPERSPQGGRKLRRTAVVSLVVAAVVGGGLAAWAFLQPEETGGRSDRSTTSTSGEEAGGRSVEEETVLGFVEAYNEADCERLADHLVATAPLPGGEDCDHRDRVQEFGGGFASDRGGLAPPATIDVSETASGTATATIFWSAAWDSPSNQANQLTETVTLQEEGGEWRLEHPLEATAYIELMTRVAHEPEPDHELWGAWIVTPDGGLPLEVRNFDPAWDEPTSETLGPAFQRGIVVAYEQPNTDNHVFVMLYEFTDPTAAEDFRGQLASRIATTTGPRRSAAVLEGVRECGDEACSTATDTIALGTVGSVVVGGRVFAQDMPPPLDQARARAAAILANQVALVTG